MYFYIDKDKLSMSKISNKGEKSAFREKFIELCDNSESYKNSFVNGIALPFLQILDKNSAIMQVASGLDKSKYYLYKNLYQYIVYKLVICPAYL